MGSSVSTVQKLFSNKISPFPLTPTARMTLALGHDDGLRETAVVEINPIQSTSMERQYATLENYLQL
jgi:hypothetical protein